MTEEPQPLSLTPPGDPAPPLVLTPPEPVAPVRTEQAAGLVPVDESVRTEMTRRATEYVGALSGLDARSPEFTTRIGEIAALGQGDIRSAAQQSNRMLDRTVRSLVSSGGVDAQSKVGSSLVKLRRTVEDLDPRDTPGRGAHAAAVQAARRQQDP